LNKKNEKMKIYISGKVTGVKHPEWKFAKTEKYLQSLGHEVLNPVELCRNDLPWKEAMIICLEELKKCNAIYVQPDWEKSRGAKIEISCAEKYGFEIIYG
jgi:hypothetical protein